MSHRARWTHTLTAEQRQQVGTDDFGEPIYDHVEVLAGEPVRYRPSGTAYVRADSGERVRKNPRVRARAAVAKNIDEGATVTLTPLSDADEDISGTTFEAVSVEASHGRSARAALAIVELEAQ